MFEMIQWGNFWRDFILTRLRLLLIERVGLDLSTRPGRPFWSMARPEKRWVESTRTKGASHVGSRVPVGVSCGPAHRANLPF